jgi:DNA-binding transcriptional ArsR family regulator
MTGNEDVNPPSFTDLDRLIHAPARLTIMAQLYVLEKADFLFLKGQTGLSWGNLSTHMTKLEEAGYIRIDKEFVDKKPHTTARLTRRGRDAFDAYRNRMKDMFEDL